MDLKELKKLKKSQLIKIIQEKENYKKKYLEIQEENIELVIKLNDMKQNMNQKLEEMLNEDNEMIKYLKKRISQTQNKKKENYMYNLKKYIN